MRRLYLFTILISCVATLSWGQSNTSINYDDAALTIKGKHGSKLKINNQYYFEGAGFTPTANFDEVLDANSDPLKLNPYANFSNLHTVLSGSFGRNWDFQFHFDYANAKLTYLNMQLDYKFKPGFLLRFGNTKVPGPMSRNSGRRSQMTLATPMGMSLASDRRMGIGLYNFSGRHFAALGFYTKNINDMVKTGLNVTPELGTAGRFTYNIINDYNQKLLLGANAYWMRMPEGLSDYTAKGGMETGLTPIRLIAMTFPYTESQLNYGLEAAYQYNNFLFIAEGLGTSFFTQGEEKDPRFIGFNARASYTVIGKPRSYNAAMGDFSGSPYVQGKGGLELGLRVTGLHHNTELTQGMLGMGYGAFVNYWLNKHLIFSLFGTYVDLSKDALGAGAYTYVGDNFNGADYFVTQARVTISF